jgi:hypothetical protein
MGDGCSLTAFHIEAGAQRFKDVIRRVAVQLDATYAQLRMGGIRGWYECARAVLED